MLKFGNKEFRNLEEQVLQNQLDIDQLEDRAKIADLGIKIISAEPLTSEDSLPVPYGGDYGDGFLVGLEAPYELFIWTRDNNEYNGKWFDWGPLNAPSVVPGPQGPAGETGPEGTRGSIWYITAGYPTFYDGVNDDDMAMDPNSGDIYQYKSGVWALKGSVKGPQGIQGIRGPQGIQGPEGPVGPEGPQGPVGDPFTIVGTLQTTSQLPSPTSVPRNYAYLIPDSTGLEHLWVIVGEDDDLTWYDAGSFGGGVQASTLPSILYATTTLGAQTTRRYTEDASGGTIVARQANGQIKVPAAPVATTDAVSKKYVDDTEDVLQAQIEGLETVVIELTGTSGTLTSGQLETLVNAREKGYILMGSKIFRYQDLSVISGPPDAYIYTCTTYNHNYGYYQVLTITVAKSGSWSLNTRSNTKVTEFYLNDNRSTTAANATNQVAVITSGSPGYELRSVPLATLRTNLAIPKQIYKHTVNFRGKTGTSPALNFYVDLFNTSATDFTSVAQALQSVKTTTGFPSQMAIGNIGNSFVFGIAKINDTLIAITGYTGSATSTQQFAIANLEIVTQSVTNLN